MKLIASNQLTVTNLLERAEIRKETFYKLTNSDVPDVPSGNRNLYALSQNNPIMLNHVSDFVQNVSIGEISFKVAGRDPYFGAQANKNEAVGTLRGIKIPVKTGQDIAVWLTNPLFVKNFVSYFGEDDKAVKDFKNYQTNKFVIPADELEGVSYVTFRFGLVQETQEVGSVHSTKVKVEYGSVATDYNQAPEDLGWSTATLIPTQQQRYLWKFEYVYYSDGSVEITAPVNLSIAGADADTTGITDAINQTNQTVTSLQNSVSQAQSDLATVSSNLTQARQNLESSIASVNTKAQAVEDDLNDVKVTSEQTADGFRTRIESLETYQSGESTRANQYFESAKTETARQLTAERTAIANDYVAKSTYTSDVTGLRNDLTATTTTANTTKTNLASYQVSNDQAVASLQSSLQTTDGNVSSLQTQINAVPGQITSAVGAVEGKIPTEIGGRNLYALSKNSPLNLNNITDFVQNVSTGEISFKVAGRDPYFGAQANKNEAVGTLRGIKIPVKTGQDIAVWLTNPLFVKNFVSYFGEDDKAVKDFKNYQTNKFVIPADELEGVSYVTFRFGLVQETQEVGSVHSTKIKVEYGNVYTDWSPAPEDTASQISSLSSQIQQTADGMTLLATKTELNTAKTELQSGISTATNKADNAQATANSNAQTISTHTTQISALNTGLQAKVSQSDFDSLSGRVTTAESNLTATANQLSSQISSVNERIPTNAVGTNLYIESKSSAGYITVYGENLGGPTVDNERTSDFIPVSANEKYVFQGWVTVPENGYPWHRYQFYDSDKHKVGNPYMFESNTPLAGKQHYAEHITVPNNDSIAYIRISARLFSDGKVKFEKGNIASDYNLAPEDVTTAQALTQAKSEIKQTTDAITASVSSVETKADNAQTTANSAVSKANAAQTAVNTLDSEVVKSASLNLDNNGFVTKVGKTIDGNKFATMIAQNANNVKIIADEMQVTADMIVDGAVTAEKLDVNNLSAVNSDLGEIKGGSLLLQENKSAGSATDNWGTYDRPAYKQGLYMDNRAFASSGAIQRKNGGETTPTDMPLAVLQAGELRFLVVDYNDNLKNVVHYGLSDPDFGAIRFEIDSELKRRLTMTSSGYLNFQASNYTNWIPLSQQGCEYMIQGRLVAVNYDVTYSQGGTHKIGDIPQEFVKKELMLTAKAWSITPNDKNFQLNADGGLHLLNADANVTYRGTLLFSY